MNKHTAVTASQAAVIRQFIAGCEVTGLLPVPNLHKYLGMLGYKQIAPGVRVNIEEIVKVPFGLLVQDKYEDEYDADWEAFVNSEIDDNASTSEPSESDTLGNVLREEV